MLQDRNSQLKVTVSTGSTHRQCMSKEGVWNPCHATLWQTTFRKGSRRFCFRRWFPISIPNMTSWCCQYWLPRYSDRNTGAKSCVCNTRNESVALLCSLITEINSEVDTETSRWRRARRARNGHQSQISFKPFPLHEFDNTDNEAESRTASVTALKLSHTQEVNRSCWSTWNTTNICCMNKSETSQHSEIFSWRWANWCWEAVNIKKKQNFNVKLNWCYEDF